jgi:hypothetical protein
MDGPTPDTRPCPAADQQADGAEAGEQAFGLLWASKARSSITSGGCPDGQGAFVAGARPRAAGSVLFSSHFGMLFVRIAYPTIAVRDGVGELAVADPYMTETGERLILADVTMQEQPGEPFDPLTLVLPDC